MRSITAARPRVKATPQISVSTSTPSPVKGINTHDSISVMNNTYALSLNNFVCKPYGVQVRQGYKRHVTGIVDSINQASFVDTLMPYIGTIPNNNKLFAASASFIFDATIVGTTTPTKVRTGFTSSKWSSTNFAIPSGHYMICANGLDATQMFDGTSWTAFSQVSSPTAPGQVSGSNPNNWTYVLAHQQRLWFIEKESTRCGYLPVQSLGGTAQILDLGAYFPRGGKLVAIGSWSLDSGAGMQEHFVAISSAGDVVIYTGYDPSTVDTWSLAGTYQFGSPVGSNPFVKYGGDLLVITQDGLVPLSKALQSARVNSSIAVSNSIDSLINSYITSFSSLYGWQVINYPGHNTLILNVPQVDRSSNQQLVMSTITGGWSQFQGIPAQCWAVFNDELYFGGYGMVGKAFSGYTDNAGFDGSGGISITGTAQQAFSYFETPGTKKKFNMVRPVIMSTGTPTVSVGCNVDYDMTPIQGNPVPANSVGVGLWDFVTWDSAVWGGQTFTFQNWQPISAIGYAASLTISISSMVETTWVSTDWIIEKGGTI